MPVFPVVDPVADTQFTVYFGLSHFKMEFGIDLQQEIIISAVDEPGDRTKLLKGGLVCVVQEVEGGMPLDRLLYLIELVFLLWIAALFLVEPSAHGIAA